MIFSKQKLCAYCIVISLCAILCLLWAFFVEPNRLCFTREKICFENWREDALGGKIVVLGDFHFSPGDEKRAEKIVNAVLAEAPDAIFLLGDYVNGHSRKASMPPETIAAVLGRLTEAAPVLAVLGNHDAYVGRSEIASALRRHGIYVFEEKGGRELKLKSGGKIFVGGTLDAHSYFPIFDSDEIPENPDTGRHPFILLSHSPDVLPFLNKTVDLTLCGHTHGGQICLPGGLPLVNSCRVAGRKFTSGMQTVPASGKAVFITRGLGTSVLPLRFFCPPEIAVIEISPKENSPATGNS